MVSCSSVLEPPTFIEYFPAATAGTLKTAVQEPLPSEVAEATVLLPKSRGIPIWSRSKPCPLTVIVSPGGAAGSETRATPGTTDRSCSVRCPLFPVALIRTCPLGTTGTAISALQVPFRSAVAWASAKSFPTNMVIRSLAPAPTPETVIRLPGRPLVGCRLRLGTTRSCTLSTLSLAVNEPKARIGWDPP